MENIDDEFFQRQRAYKEDHCWQYDIRINNLEEDLKLLPIDVDYTTLKIDDFTFKVLTSQKEHMLAGEFIRRHEWLGKLALNTSHYFGCYYKDILAGVITMGVPNAFSKLLGDTTSELERLINRGACISWSPKCLASAFLMWCIKWMVANTPYRIFTCYSDPQAKELGTIYQACNFYYLGNTFGATAKYVSPYSGKLVSDRVFRARSYYKRYAQDLGISWQEDWSKGDKIFWEIIPYSIVEQLKAYGKEKQATAQVVYQLPKHKYCYILGNNKKETKDLRKQFLSKNKIYPYPKERGK